jgi:superfamily II DNA/RNA helicase
MVVTHLKYQGFNIAGYRTFSLKSKELSYLVVDKIDKNINFSFNSVINYQFPPSPEAYIERAALLQNLDKQGVVISLLSIQEIGTLYHLKLMYKLSLCERTLPQNQEDEDLHTERIQTLLEDFPSESEEEWKVMAQKIFVHPKRERILASLLKDYFYHKKMREKKTWPATQMDTLYLNLGRRHGGKVYSLSRFIQNQCNLLKKDIGKIKIGEYHTIFEVRSEVTNRVISLLSEATYERRRLFCERVKRKEYS